MNQQQPKKRIYISRSMLTNITFINQLIGLLNQNGQEAYCFIEGIPYNDKLVRTADLVIAYSHKLIGKVDKGQHSEIQLAKRLDIPVFFIDQPDLTGVLFNIDDPVILDVNSWKQGYSIFKTKSIGISIAMYLQTPQQSSYIDEKLLLIINI